MECSLLSKTCSLMKKCSVGGLARHVLKSSTVPSCSDVLSGKARPSLHAWGLGGGGAVSKGSSVCVPATSAHSQGISNMNIMAMENEHLSVEEN